MASLDRHRIDAPGGPTLAYAQDGAGPDVLLLHGGMSTLDDLMIGLGDALVGHGLRVTAFDRPGHGHSGRETLVGSCWRQAQVIHAAAMRLGLRRPVVIGHSFGGATAMTYALQFPQDCAGIVALAPIAVPELRLEHWLFAPRATPLGELINPLIAATTDRLLLPALWRAMFLPQAMPEPFRAGFPFDVASRAAQVEADGEDAMSINGSLARAAALYPFCQTRVQVFGGDRDLVVNNALHGRTLARLAPKGDYRSLPGLGHMTHHFASAPIAEAARQMAG